MGSALNISLPPDMRKWLEQQIASKRYSTPTEAVLDALRKEQAREAREQVDKILLDAIESGPSTPMGARDWKRIRAGGEARYHARRGK